MAVITNTNNYTLVSGTSSADSITNYGYKVTISSGNGDDTVRNVRNYDAYGASSAESVSINTGAGNDSVYNFYGHYATIDMGAGNDSVYNYDGYYATINTGAGNDYVYNYFGYYATINTGAGNDSVYNYDSSYKTINTGAGNDLISLNSSVRDNVIIYTAGDGNDTIYGFDEEDILSISGGTYSTAKSGNNIIVTVGNGKISLIGAASLNAVNINDGLNTASNTLVSGTSAADIITNYGEKVTIRTGNGDDTVRNVDNYSYGSNSADSVSVNTGAGNDSVRNNCGYYATINTGAGNDSVYNYDGNYATINTGAGNDSVYNYLGIGATINTGEGNDSVYNNGGECAIILTGAGNDSVYNSNGEDATINTGTGNDSVYNNGGECAIILTGAGNDSVYNHYGDDATINTGAGNDSVFDDGWRSTINTGAGNDLISLNAYSEDNVIEYNLGDGNDIIYGFNGDDTLSISGGTYSTTKSGNDVIVSVGDGKISLIGAASLSAVNIKGTEGETETNSWTLNGTTATYGTSSNTLFTITGVKSTIGLSINGKVVTVSNASVNATNITISGDGYTLALGSNVTKPSTTNSWSLSNSTASYNQTKTAGYTLASNAKSITYSKKSATTLTKVTGVKSTDGLKVSGKVVTVSASSLNQAKVTITGSYTLALGDDVAKPSTTAAGWNLSGTTATYKSSSKSAGYTPASNAKSITYTAGTTAKTLATVTGVKSKTGLSLSSKTFTLKNAALNKKVTVNGSGYTFNFAADYSNATITGSANADIIQTRGNNISVFGGKGNDTIKIFGSATSVRGGDGADVFIFNGSGIITDYAAGDKISVNGTADISTSGNDVIFNDKITVKGAADKTVSYIDSGGADTYTPENTVSTEGVIISADGKSVTLTADYMEDNFNVADYGAAIQTINAAAVALDVNITANQLMNSILGGAGNDTIIGGKSNDTLTGGGGSDVFVYNFGDGNDTITDYTSDEDMIQINGVDSITHTEGTSDMVLKIGSVKITLKKMAGKKVTYRLGDGSELYINDGDNPVIKGTTATLTDNNYGATFDARTYQTQIKNINASARTADINIIGNAQANSIVGGSGNDTLWGGSGNDSLKGGSGSDVFVYSTGDGNDIITDYAEEDKISIAGTANVSTSGNDVIFTIGNGKITVKDGYKKVVTYIDSTGTNYFPKDPPASIVSGNGVTLRANYEAMNYTATSKIVTVDASAVNHDLRIKGNGLANDIYGGSGNDSINGGAKADTLSGGSGDDILLGESGNDAIFGGEGNDTLTGGAGNDELWGGEGSDTFIYKSGAGKDIIYGFSDEDTLTLDGLDFTTSYKNDALIFKVGSTANAITLKDFTASTFHINGDSYHFNGSKLVVSG